MQALCYWVRNVLTNLFRRCILKIIRSVAPMTNLCLRGKGCEEMDKKIPARSITTTNRRCHPNPCSSDNR